MVLGMRMRIGYNLGFVELQIMSFYGVSFAILESVSVQTTTATRLSMKGRFTELSFN